MSDGIYQGLPLNFERRKTRAVRVGKVTIGGGHPVVVQSMITEETKNVDACVRQITRMARAGAELVRVTTPSLMEAHKLGEIQEKLRARLVDVPLVADVHHQGSEIAQTVAEFVDKVRINPGLFVFHRHTGKAEFTDAEHDEQRAAIEESLLPVIEVCKRRDIALRVGVNHGSLAERMLVTFGDTPEGMVQSALEYLRICEKHDFRNLVISLKASRVPIMLAANRLMVKRMDAEGMDYPLHLGVTEAGDGQYARIKSTAGIATLLAEGIGDTIRVSLSEDPVEELPVCYEILQALGLRKTQVEFIACPSCGRTKFDLPTVLNQVKAATSHLVGLDIAVMGCFPPGETVMTSVGFRPIESIATGDRVLTRDGSFSPVTQIDTHEFEGDLVSLTPRGAPPLRCTPNHPVLALAPKDKVLGGEPLWYAAEDLTHDHVLLYPILQGEAAVATAPDAPNQIVDEAFLAHLGSMATNGGMTERRGRAREIPVDFGWEETILALKVAEALGLDDAMKRMDRATGRQPQEKRLPSWTLMLPKRQQVLLLKSLWAHDGDLRATRGGSRATFATKSPTLAFQVHQLLLRQGIAAAIDRKPFVRRPAVYTISVTGPDALRRFAEAMGVEIIAPEGRNRDARLVIDDRFLYLPILGIERVGYAGPVHNLEIGGAQTYVSSLCIVHNCIVNGPGEMADADYGYVGKAGGKITLYRKREEIRTVDQSVGVEALVELIQSDGRWQEPGTVAPETTPDV